MFGEILHNSDLAESAVPLDIITEFLNKSGAKLNRRTDRVAFSTPVGETTLLVDSKKITTVDGAEISDIVTISTDLPDTFNFITDEQIAVLNAMSALSALMRDTKRGRLCIGSRLTSFRHDNDTWRLYTPLVCTAALLQADLLIKIIRNTPDLKTKEGFACLFQSEEPSKWNEQEFERAAAVFERLGIFANAGSQGLTAEFPWGVGASSATFGHETSLLTLQANMPHPVLGHGLFYKLELPVQLDESALFDLCNRVNLFELYAVDAPPFFGAWCCNLNAGHLAHVGFWPNVLYLSGTALNIAVWMIHRSKIVHSLIEDEMV
ncbi:MAG: hypothetical protein PVI06_20180 [Desulfobacterales bacterium]|jgi:hypothetical protein